jgi:hypothetical protein
MIHIEGDGKDSLVYRSGDAFVPEPLRSALFTYIIGGPRTLFYINYWSIIHFISGIVFGSILYVLNGKHGSLQYYVIGFIIHTIWELWQMLIGMSIYSGAGSLRQWIDTCVDTILFIGGMYVFSAFSRFVRFLR